MVADIIEKGNVLVVTLDGRFVATCAEDVKNAVAKRMETNHNVLFDLSKMAHVDSSGLGVFVFLLQKAKAAHGTVKLACLQPHARIVFDITKVYRVFEIFDSVDAALDSFPASAEE